MILWKPVGKSCWKSCLASLLSLKLDTQNISVLIRAILESHLKVTAYGRCTILQENLLDGPKCAGSGQGPVRLSLSHSHFIRTGGDPAPGPTPCSPLCSTVCGWAS